MKAIQSEYPRKNGCEVRITTNDGQQYMGRVEHAKGEPENMLTDSEFEQKFRYLVDGLLSEAQISTLMNTIYQLESLEDVGEINRMTVPTLVTA